MDQSRPLYEHRQVGWVVMLGAAIPFVCLAAFWLMAPPFQRSLPPLLVPILCVTSSVLLLGFSTLSTSVTRTHVVLRFGIGLYRRSIPLERIRRALTTESRWYEGWGIHWTRRGMLYNVGGSEAVQLDLVDGKSLRIGSDDADRLRNAISRALGDFASRGRPTS